MEGVVKKIVQKHSFWELFGSIFNSERVFWIRMVKWVCEMCSYHSETNGRVLLSKPWEIDHFSSFNPIFPLVPP